MFSNNKPANGNIKRPDAQLETMVGAESFFQGTLRSKGSIRIDGKIEGGVSADGVIVGEQGEIQGDVSARTVVVGGKVSGNIHATESLELLAKSQVFGDLHVVYGKVDGHIGQAPSSKHLEKTCVSWPMGHGTWGS